MDFMREGQAEGGKERKEKKGRRKEIKGENEETKKTRFFFSKKNSKMTER